MIRVGRIALHSVDVHGSLNLLLQFGSNSEDYATKIEILYPLRNILHCWRVGKDYRLKSVVNIIIRYLLDAGYLHLYY
jgi:hypothetical protein